jgi:hypothetical protein
VEVAVVLAFFYHRDSVNLIVVTRPPQNITLLAGIPSLFGYYDTHKFFEAAVRVLFI